MTVDEALEHPYLASYVSSTSLVILNIALIYFSLLQHDPEDEPTVAPLDPDYFEFDDHKEDLTKADLKELLYEEILSFVPSI